MENNIIRIYKKRKYNEYLIEKREAEAKVKDVYKTLADNYNEELLKLLKAENREDEFSDYSIEFNIPVSNERRDELQKIEKDFKDKMDDRNRLIDEVEAQIELCATREEMLEVFKAYGILDDNNKIYDYR